MSGSAAADAPQRYRTIWISDVHLGTHGCQADLLLDFLRETDSDTLFLVGDIIDGWRLRKKFHWSQSHNDVIQKLLRKARKGVKVIFIPGNHDEFLRDYIGLQFGGVLLRRDYEYDLRDGRRFLICHGDEFDVVTKHHKWVAYLGDTAYTMLLWFNTHLNTVRRKIGLPYWSLSAYLKHKAKRAADFLSRFETALADEARRRGLDGVICGHIHHAERRMIRGVDYCNDGDWVESCTALVEHQDGRLEILHWTEEMGRRGVDAPGRVSDRAPDRAPDRECSQSASPAAPLPADRRSTTSCV